MGWISDKLGLVTKCTLCENTQGIEKCPHCDNVFCDNCLSPLVTLDGWPEFFKGNKVENIDALEKLINAFLTKAKNKNYKIHICKEFISYRWDSIDTYLRKLSARKLPAKFFTFK